jgi:hypothetical protein
LPIRVGFPLDSAVLAFALGLGLATGFVFGLAPALQAARRETTRALRDAAPTGLRRLFGRKALVATQLAFSLVLRAASGLLLRALGRARSIEIGFEPGRVESFAVDLDLAGCAQGEVGAAQSALAERIAPASALRAEWLCWRDGPAIPNRSSAPSPTVRIDP